MRSSIPQKDLAAAEQKPERRRIRDIFVSPGTRKAALVITVMLPALLMAYAWFMNHRPPLHIKSEWTFRDTLIQNSDLLLSFVFLIVSGFALLSCLRPEEGKSPGIDAHRSDGCSMQW